MSILKRKTFLLHLFLFFCAQNLSAQNFPQIKFNHIGRNNLISKVKINDIQKDNQGFLWMASDEGLIKFDGINVIKHLNHNIRDTNSFRTNSLRCIIKEKNGKLWLATDGIGLYLFDPITEKKILYSNPYKSSSTNRIWNMVESPDGQELYLSTFGGGVNIFNKKTKQFKSILAYDSIKNGLPNNAIMKIDFDSKGTAWICTRHNWLTKYNPKTGEFKNFHNFNNDNGIHFISGMAIYNDDIIYLSTPDGLFEFSTITETFKRYIQNEKDNSSFSTYKIEQIFISKNKTIYLSMGDGSLDIMDHKTKKCEHYKSDAQNPFSITPTTLINSYYEDDQGLIWLGLNKGGLDVIIPSAFKYQSWVHDDKNKNSIVSHEINNITEDSDHKIWIGTYGGGASCFDPDKQTFRNIIRNDKDKTSISDGLIYSFHYSNNGYMWLCTENGLNKLNLKTFKVEKKYFTKEDELKDVKYQRMNRTSRILEDQKGNFWISMIGGGLAYFNAVTETFERYKFNENDTTSISDNRIFDMVYDSLNQVLWLSCYQGGLTAFDIHTKKSRRFTHKYSDINSMSSNWCFEVTIDPQTNMLWIGTEGGLNGLDLNKYKTDKSTSFFHFTKNEGLLDDAIYAILPDGKGNLWLSSAKSMYHYFPPNNMGGTSNEKLYPYGILKIYNEANGLPFSKVEVNSILYSKYRNRIYMGLTCLCSFNPDSIKENKVIPPVYITEIKLFNKAIFVDTVIYQYKSLNLDYFQNSLGFTFSAPSLMFPENNKFAYMLVGYDKDWIYSTSKNEINYTNLDPGVYEFKVKAANNDGYWNETGATIYFKISPPFWKAKWFYFLMTIIGISIIIATIKIREKKLVREKLELENKVIARTKELLEEKEIVQVQKEMIEEKHKEITDSINYAERIQRSFLATKELLDQNLKDYFIFFQPKDIVSGDFYWANKLHNGNFAFVTADSTGHGVPGAIMSLLNITSLEKAVEKYHQPSEILNTTRNIIIERLKKDGSTEGGKDGMDASIISFNFKENKLIYAAANNPVWIVRDVRSSGVENKLTLIELAQDKMPIGKHDKDFIPFTQHEINLQKGDVVYTLTDGIADQFGGMKGKKFMYKQLKQLLISIAQLPMQKQKETLQASLNNWKGNLEQVDDICLIGIRI